MIVAVPREATPLVDDGDTAPLADRPAAGHWVMGIRWPLCIWWRCPMCQSIVPMELAEVDEVGLVVDPVHAVAELGPLCKWSSTLRLSGYDRAEHLEAVKKADASLEVMS